MTIGSTQAQGARSARSRAGLVAPWYAAYALAGLLVNGLVPVLLPLTAAPRGPVVVSTVVAAFFAGQLTAPLIGGIADRRGLQRVVFLGSFPVMAVGAVVLGLADQTAVWIGAAAVAGVAAGAAQTTASVFVVEGHPRQEWDRLIGWFRMVFGVGQVAGLLIGAMFADGRLELGWIVSGAVILVGTFVGRIGLPHLHRVKEPRREPGVGRGRGVVDVLRSRFGVFLLTWLLAMIGVQSFLNLMPLVMREAFGVEPSTTAWVYLAGSVVGVFLYPVCGRIAERRTVRFVLAIGLIANLVAFTVMAADLLLSEGNRGALASVALVSVAIAYPFDYIGATLMAAVLAPDGGEGAAMGLFNSGVAAGAVIGILAASPLAKTIGYEAIPPLAAVMLLLALLVGARLLFARSAEKPPVSFARG